jgi:hypothetical protein
MVGRWCPCLRKRRFHVRSLRVYRLGLGAVVLYDIFVRFFQGNRWALFYSNEGIIHEDDLFAAPVFQEWAPGLFSLVSENCHPYLIAFGIVSSLALAGGYHTGKAAFCTWLFVSSVHARNPLLTHFADAYVSSLLFCTMFVTFAPANPIRKKAGAPHGSGTLTDATYGNTLLVTQVGLVFFSAAYNKSGQSWWADGSAVADVLALDPSLNTHAGSWLHTHLVQVLPAIAWRCITWSVLLIEYLLGGLTLVSVVWPFPSARVVHGVGLAGIALEIVFSLTLDLGWTFLMAFVLGWVPFLGTHDSGGDEDVVSVPLDEHRAHGVKQRFAVAAIVFITLLNAISCGLWLPQFGRLASPLADFKEPLVSMGNAVHIKQQWSMFSPDPPSTFTAHGGDEEMVALANLFMQKSLASKDDAWMRLLRLVEQDQRFGRQIAQRFGRVAWGNILVRRRVHATHRLNRGRQLSSSSLPRLR